MKGVIVMIIRYDNAFVNLPSHSVFCFRIHKGENTTALNFELENKVYKVATFKLISDNLDDILERLLEKIIRKISVGNNVIDINELCSEVITELEQLVDEISNNKEGGNGEND